MSVPVAILILPTVAIGAALMAGGENSPWSRYFAPQFVMRTLPPAPISEIATSLIVLLRGPARSCGRVATLCGQERASQRRGAIARRVAAHARDTDQPVLLRRAHRSGLRAFRRSCSARSSLASSIRT